MPYQPGSSNSMGIRITVFILDSLLLFHGQHIVLNWSLSKWCPAVQFTGRACSHTLMTKLAHCFYCMTIHCNHSRFSSKILSTNLLMGSYESLYSKFHPQIYILQLTNFMFSLSEGNHWENDMKQSETTM